LQNYVNHSAATVVRKEDSSGKLVSVSEYAKGKVIRRLERNAETESTAHDILEIELLAGTYKGQNLILRNVIQKKMPLLTIPAEPGDIVLCRVGGSPDQIGLVNLVQEYGRDRFLIWMFGVMLVVIILVGRNEGVRTVIAMVASGLIIYFFMLPLIAGGNPPVLIVVLSSGMIAFCSLVFVIGPSRKTLSAVISTMAGVTIAGLIVVIAQHYLHFSGMENAISADIVEAVGIPFDFRQLLLAGMLIGLLGVAVDGAIEVSSSMEEVRRANPQMSSWHLISSGMNVGTDILGTMVNTLLFAYIGVRILLLMAIIAPDLRNSLFASPVVELLSIGITAAEILRLLAGTLGLVLVIPITAIISAFWHRRS
ncbi:MAG: YibE/F family protein, partial [Candidatus Poribacteria bacterium]|nr:YibE/F family protein [Candidatus Poribacteria bacterium]